MSGEGPGRHFYHRQKGAVATSTFTDSRSSAWTFLTHLFRRGVVDENYRYVIEKFKFKSMTSGNIRCWQDRRR